MESSWPRDERMVPCTGWQKRTIIFPTLCHVHYPRAARADCVADTVCHTNASLEFKFWLCSIDATSTRSKMQQVFDCRG